MAAREPAHGREAPVVVAPDVRLRPRSSSRRTRRGGSHVLRRDAAGGAGPGRGNRDGRPVDVSVDDLELVPLADGALMDVAGEDELGPGVDKPGEDVRAPRDRPLPRAPGRTEQVVVEDGDPQRARRGLREELACPGQLPLANAARLVPPGADRVEPDDLQRGRGVTRAQSSPSVARTRRRFS